MVKIIAVLATLFATAGAYCPNGCSKNGSCGVNGETNIFFVERLVFFDYFVLTRFVIFGASNYNDCVQTNAPVIIDPTEIQLGWDTIAL